ncbi:Rox3-domain-containing protein [Xylariaceae sp. FL1019]|nr:Rox3-domain-containing protein [Xylariaceae sp. FL1019]
MSFHPQTPQSPSQFSPSVMDQGSSINTSMTSIATSLPTPAHSVNGSHMPSDGSHDTIMTDISSSKRKNSFDDAGAHEHKKALHEDPRKIGIQDLHLDVGEKLLLCRTRKAPLMSLEPHPHFVSSPRMSDDLFEKFGLAGIAADVARTKPDGSKNALRKTYKGQIKTLSLNGHFDVVKKDPSPLMELLGVAEEDWQNRVVSGKGIVHGLTLSQSTIAKATTMAKGQIPKAVWDSSVLGDLAPGQAPKRSHDQPSRPTAPGTPNPSTVAGAASKAGKPLTSQMDRARRLGKKRSYQDSSFEGYGEGYDDDTGGYSTGDGDDRSSKLKRRKQVHPPDHPSSRTPLADRL